MHLLISIVILVLVVLALIDAINVLLAGEQKILWFLLSIFVPVAGLILYYLLVLPCNVVSWSG